MSSMGAFNSNNNFDDDDDDDNHNDNSDGSTRITDYEKYWFHFVRWFGCTLTHTHTRMQCAFHLRNSMHKTSESHTIDRQLMFVLIFSVVINSYFGSSKLRYTQLTAHADLLTILFGSI